jgi:drug/metabolite transporter (DMT)-like permease
MPPLFALAKRLAAAPLPWPIQPGTEAASRMGFGALHELTSALFTTGARAIPASEAGLLALTEVMLAPFWVWLFWNETTSRDTLIGGAVLLAALILNALGTGWDMAARARATAKAEP